MSADRKTAIIIATGSELLAGKVLDTNSQFLSTHFFGTDISIKEKIIIGDDLSDLIAAFRQALTTHDLVLVTGGLGPTDDDNTIKALQEIAGFEITRYEPAVQRITDIFTARSRTVSERDLKMAEVPVGAKVLENPQGLAPGFIIEHGNSSFIAMPGVPVEVEAIFLTHVIPYVHKRFNLKPEAEYSFHVCGMIESEINEHVDSFLADFDITHWGVSMEMGIASVTLISQGRDSFNISDVRFHLEKIFGTYLLDEGCNTPWQELVELLRISGSTFSCAESCTGGLISSRITDVPGASDVFMGSIVSYSNEMKVELLNVNRETIEAHGAVSEETAEEMARGVASVTKSDYAISITGIAGPGGGSREKPVGTVCFGIYDHGNIETFTHKYTGDRQRIRSFGMVFSINYLRRLLKK